MHVDNMFFVFVDFSLVHKLPRLVEACRFLFSMLAMFSAYWDIRKVADVVLTALIAESTPT